MTTALARKEIRELLPIALVALLAQLFLLGAAIHLPLGPLVLFRQDPSAVPFVDSDIIEFVFVVAAGLAIAVGLRQTMWESGRGTFPFLLHRPVARETIFGVKLAAGLAVYLLVTVLPLLGYALWAATPGTHPSPFFWPMTLWAWQLCLELPLLYLGAFLSGLRLGRWFASRFLPLAAAALVLIMLGFFTTMGARLVAVAVALAMEACFALAILDVARSRDYS